MLGIGERAYAYAKACGIIGKSFVGKRIARLAEVSRISDLDRLVFPHESRDLPARELLVDIEARIIQRAVNHIITIIDSFEKPPELLLRFVRTYEYEDLKTVCGALAQGETKSPIFTDIGRFRTIDFEAYPDLDAMLRGTEFEFLLQDDLRPDNKDAKIGDLAIQSELDRHYYRSLWEALFALKKNDRTAVEKILCDEVCLRNAVLALRLRIYYGMSAEEIREKFISLESKNLKAFLVGPAEASLALTLDNRTDWKDWKWERFLNPEKPGEPWRVDPRHFQNAASKYLYRRARFFFRRKPSSLDSIFCFIKLKLFEEDLLTSVAEGLGMGLSSRDVFTLLEVET
ncbi:MAG: V-type ATPase subunit [Spirochaetaceae bacterium]|jgi:vacuolar-type H+-ATPase subunit C/Vma6|nr:V-type ATPase subunit [Spirochaetaceae bacterium]